MIRSTYDPVNRTQEMDVLRPVMTADLLVLDDLGAEKTSEWVEETLNLIVNARYSEKRVTVFTSNYDDNPDSTDPDSLLFRIGFRMRSRLHEMCEFLYLDGADYRELPRNGGVDDLIDMWKMRSKALRKRRALPAQVGRPGARPAAREPDGGADLQVVRRRSRQQGRLKLRPGASEPEPMLSCWASTSTSRSARRSATTATSTAVCSTQALKARYVDAVLPRDPARAPSPWPADSIFFGGGTPSLLDPADVGAHPRRVPRRVRRDAPTPRSRSKPTPRA